VSDRILACLGILGLIAYFLPLLVKVPAPALIVVLGMTVLMAAFDFVLELRDHQRDHSDKLTEL
jgi:hypothetical protein